MIPDGWYACNRGRQWQQEWRDGLATGNYRRTDVVVPLRPASSYPVRQGSVKPLLKTLFFPITIGVAVFSRGRL